VKWVTVYGSVFFIINQPLRPTQPGYPSVCRSNEMVMVIAREEMVSSTLCPKKVVHKTRGENFVNS